MNDWLKEDRFRSKCLTRIAFGRFGVVEDVTPIVLFLASDEAKYVTGQVIYVDGGMPML